MTRVIAGAARGRRLQVPSGTTTRPTSDRAREGMFSSLQSLLDLEDARVVDLYAGSGALGLEAISRGAGSATLVESDPDAVAALRANVEHLGFRSAFVVAQPVERFLAVDPEPRYDLALLDPPYELAAEPVLELLLPWLADGAVVALERRHRGPGTDWPQGYEPVRERTVRRGRPAVRASVAPMRRAVCPGSFDPVTLGHLDIVERASKIYDEVTVAVLVNKKKSSLYTVEERMELLTEVTAAYGNVRVDSFHGLLVDYCRVHDIPVIVKGLRAISDFDYELQMAQMNHGLAGVETMFMTTNPLYSFLSSSAGQGGRDVRRRRLRTWSRRPCSPR